MANQSVLVIAAHSDDEALGCGGTIAKHAARGDHVSVMFMTDGVGSRGKDDAAARARAEASQAALEVLGVKSHRNENFPDNAMDTVPLLELAKALEQQIEDVKPTIVYTHHAGDLNVDHRMVHEAAMTALRPQPGSLVKTILTFEVASSTEWRAPQAGRAFLPNWYVDITDQLEIKMAALEHYNAEMREWPHSRSVQALRHLAHHRGATIGVEAAEAFQLVRAIH